MVETEYDVAIVGGGHNGLVAAAYLAKAGKKVVVLEKLDVLGGAAISAQTFKGIDAKLSRYSYLVSLLPEQIINDLGLDVHLAPRRFGSFTAEPNSSRGLLIDKADVEVTKGYFASIDAERDFEAWNNFYERTELIAKKLFKSLLEPLRTENEVRDELGEQLWKDFFEQPIGKTISDTFQSDLVRGVVMTDALIGTFASNLDQNLDANKCFLYHVIGNETGEWQIPIGGMGAVTTSMAKQAESFGAELRTNCTVTAITEDRRVRFIGDGEEKEISAEFVLANVSKPILEKLLGNNYKHNIQGAQVKVNMLLKRLPKLRADVDPVAAFSGTFHINENFSQLQTAYETAELGKIPDPLPLEIYCHSLTDPTILARELQQAGAQTLTVFALHTPHSLVQNMDNEDLREQLQKAVIKSINSVLTEDILDVLLRDSDGNLCIEAKTTLDLEDALGLPGGNIFHGPLSWPFVSDQAELDSPAKRWGVESGYENIYFCGSTARRGGAVSGIGGHNAAMAVLENAASSER